MQDFQRVIGRAVLDEHFRAQLFSDPNSALQGFNLTPQEIQMLGNVSLDQFNNLVQQFGEELARGDTFMKACATGQHIKKAQLMVRKAGGDSADYYQKPDDPAGLDFVFQKIKHDYIEQDNFGSRTGPGESDPPPKPGSKVVALVVIAIIAVLIGLLLPAAFAPTDTVKGALHTMGFSFACAPAPEGSQLPAVQIAVGDVNGDGVSDEADVAAGKAGGQQQQYLEIKLKEIIVTGYQTGGSDQGLNLGGILIGLNDMRLAVGNEGFLPDCGDNTSDPQEGGATANEGEDGGVTGGATGGTTGGQPEDVAPPDGDLCANNGGIQWQGTACVCPGLIDNVTMCADGTKIDQVTDQTCVPEQACDQPPDPQNPPSACPCTYVCLEQVVGAAAACNKYGWRDCTGAVCTPPQTP